MRKEITVTAEPREKRGKNEARRLRVRGMAPAVVYGPGVDPIALAINPKDLNRILHSGSGHNTIFNLGLEGSQPAPVMIVDWQHDPIHGRLLHVDLKRIDLTQRITIKVPVRPQGEPKGVKQEGGLHEIITREVEIECLPDEIPEEFVVDVTELMLGQSMRAGQIALTGSMKLISPPEAVLTHVIAMRAEEPEPAAADAAAVAPTAVAEPEVIKKGKKEEEAIPEGEDKKKKKKE